MHTTVTRVTCGLLLAGLVVVSWAREPQEAPAPGPRPAPGGHDHDAKTASVQPPKDAPWAPERLVEGMQQYLPAALRAAQQPDPAVRRGGLFILGLLGLPEGQPVALRALADRDRLVRMQAGVALAMLYDARGLAAASVALREGPEWGRFYALYGLWRLNSARSRAALQASRGYLPGALVPTLDQALRHLPKLRCNTLRRGPTGTAISLFRLWSDVSGAFVVEGDMWWHQGDYDQSIRAQWTALFFDPEYVDLYTNIAWLQWSMGRHADAIRTYRRCIAANPRTWQAHQALGTYYWRHGHRQLAAQYLQQAADLGSPPLERRQLGHAYRDLGEAEKARKVWQDILEMDPNDPIARRELERAGQGGAR